MSADGVYSVVAPALECRGWCCVLGLVLQRVFVLGLVHNALIFIEIEGNYV